MSNHIFHLLQTGTLGEEFVSHIVSLELGFMNTLNTLSCISTDMLKVYYFKENASI